MRPTLVALDLDGTLLEHPGTIAPAHAQAVRDLLARGIQVMLVTGRPLVTTTWVWRALGLATPVVCFNGSWIGRPDAPALISAPLSAELVRSGLAALTARDGAICAYPDPQSWIMNREIPHTQRWREVYGVPIAVVPERFQNWQGQSFKLMYVCSPKAIEDCYPQLKAQLRATHEVVLSQEDRVEILPLGVTKASGLAHVAERLGIPAADVWAVGDAENDLEMLRWAGHGCAMGQAVPALRAVARHILPTVHECGLTALPALIAGHADAADAAHA